MPTVTSALFPTVAVFGGDELGLITATTGATVPPPAPGQVFRLALDSWYNKASNSPAALLSPANQDASDLGNQNFSVVINSNAMTCSAVNALTLKPNTKYKWVYHFPKQ